MKFHIIHGDVNVAVFKNKIHKILKKLWGWINLLFENPQSKFLRDSPSSNMNIKLKSFAILHGQYRANKTKNERVIDRKSPKPIRYQQKTSHMYLEIKQIV